MAQSFRCYLAGDIRPDNWRQKVLQRFLNREGIEFLFPQTGFSYEERSLAQTERYRTGYQVADLLKVDQADVVLAVIEKDSPSAYSGTSAEIGYAKAKGKYIILVKEPTTHLYAFIKRISNIVFDKLDDALAHLEDIWEEMTIKGIK